MEKKKNKLWIVLAVLVLLVIAVVVTVILLNKKDTYRVIKIYEVDGVVSVKRDGVDDLSPYANMLLKSGDTVVVDKGTMTLKLDEDKYVYVEENTEFSIVADGTSADSKTTIELKKGAITNEIQNKLSTESSYEVNTPNSTMAVRGTVFRVEISYDENGVCYTKVSVLEGAVSSKLVYEDGSKSENEVKIEKGYEVIIYQDEKVTEYLMDASPIDYSQLPETVRNRFAELIEEWLTTEETTEEVTTEETEGTTEETTEEVTTEAMADGKINETTEATTEEVTTEATTEATAKEYTVTFVYNGAVFGTQTVTAGECAKKPSLMPAQSGAWDYDFAEPVESDITITWK